MNKKQKRKERQRRRRKVPDIKRRATEILIGIKKFSWKHWLTVTGILIPVAASFAIYYLSLLDADIRVVKVLHMQEVDSIVQEQKYSLSYQAGVFRFKNFSFKSGFVDKLEFVPNSLSSGLDIKVLEVEKKPIGWREETDIRVKWVITADGAKLTEETVQQKPLIFTGRFYDNTGRQIPDISGLPTYISIDGTAPLPQPSASPK